MRWKGSRPFVCKSRLLPFAGDLYQIKQAELYFNLLVVSKLAQLDSQYTLYPLYMVP